jgi:hypothetical protein
VGHVPAGPLRHQGPGGHFKDVNVEEFIRKEGI